MLISIFLPKSEDTNIWEHVYLQHALTNLSNMVLDIFIPTYSDRYWDMDCADDPCLLKYNSNRFLPYSPIMSYSLTPTPWWFHPAILPWFYFDPCNFFLSQQELPSNSPLLCFCLSFSLYLTFDSAACRTPKQTLWPYFTAMFQRQRERERRYKEE